MSEEASPVIDPYAAGPAVCRDHDPRTAEVARQITALIAAELPQTRVEHVGSTAVPGCAGRGIVDLMIPVADGETDRVVQHLEQLGFQCQSDVTSFAEDRSIYAGAWKWQGKAFALHVYVILANAAEAEEMRFFRSCLRRSGPAASLRRPKAQNHCRRHNRSVGI